MNKNNSVRGEYKKLNTALIAVFLCLVAILNIIVFALSEKYEWYIYKEESYKSSIGTASEHLFADKEQKDVKIIFCMEEDELASDVIYDLVWQTAVQLQDKFDFITVENVNIYLQPSKLSKYKYITYEDGTPVVTNTETGA